MSKINKLRKIDKTKNSKVTADSFNKCQDKYRTKKNFKTFENENGTKVTVSLVGADNKKQSKLFE